MARCIDLDKYENYYLDCRIKHINRGCDKNCVKCYCNNGGVEDVEPIIHAKWEPMTNPIEWTDGREHFECSNCGIYHAPLKNERYCPYCGARMSKR